MKRVYLNEEICVSVDDEDYDIISRHKWTPSIRGGENGRRRLVYAFRQYTQGGKRITVYMHRLIAGASAGECVDHINGDTLDNTRGNLRRCTSAENIRNSASQFGASSSYKGVHWCSSRNKWVASIGFNGRVFNLGRYTSEVEAAIAYNMAATRMFGDFARCNVV